MFIRAVQHNSGLDAFRAEVRAFCQNEMPAEVRAKQARGQHLERHEYDAWLKRLGSRGWLTGKWPKEHGGLGWQPEQFLAFQEELGRAGAPPLISFGPTMAGPVIYTFGTPEQKKKYLSGIIKNETWWCQGYSEPGAGSDLASLKTRAIRDGDTYVVNGQKIWTSMAHWADMIFALVRTDPDAKKQEGISFLLIDMKSPGITVRPIIGITLGHHLNEVFFENVRVPVENLIGEENKGWTYAKFLLANERVGNVDIAKLESYLGQIRRLLDETKESGRALAEDPVPQRRLQSSRVGFATVKALMADQLPPPAQRRAVADGRRRAEAARDRAGASHSADGLEAMADTAWSSKAMLCMPGGTAS
jgi:alkylation response protein AidB-like acyl-CoA dehydrogenase